MKKLVEDTLKEFGYYSVDAANLILGTIAQESAFGKYRKQINGPALGIPQMEPNTFRDICKNYLKYHTDITAKIKEVAKVNLLLPDDLIINDKLAICMCRVHYLRRKEPIPTTVEGYASYWKRYYNTIKGKGTEAEFIRNYHLYVLNSSS